ncbi:hypothetical protein Tco_0324387, partial [Tanacetum coccineum]
VDPYGLEGYSNQTQANEKAIFVPCFIANCFNAGYLKMEVKKSKEDKIVEAALDLEVENEFGEGGDLGYLGKDKDEFGTKLDPISYKERLDVDSDVENGHPERENVKKRKTTEELMSATTTTSSEPTKKKPPPTSSKQPKQHTAVKTSSFDWEVDSTDDTIKRVVIEEEKREIPLEKVSRKFLDELKLMGSFGMPIIVDYTRMEETKNELLRWCCKNNIENDYHVDQVRNYIKSQVVWRRENEILENPFPQSEAPIFYGPSNNPNLTNTKNKKYTLSLHNIHATTFIDLEEITTRWIRTLIEDMYLLKMQGKLDHVKCRFLDLFIVFIRSYVILARVHDFQLGIKSYQFRINLTAPTLTFPGIYDMEPYIMITKLLVGFIYQNNQLKNRFMDYQEICKFCDTKMNRVLERLKLIRQDHILGFSRKTTYRSSIETT